MADKMQDEKIKFVIETLKKQKASKSSTFVERKR
jgi:hypothetical protein